MKIHLNFVKGKIDNPFFITQPYDSVVSHSSNICYLKKKLYKKKVKEEQTTLQGGGVVRHTTIQIKFNIEQQ